MSEDQPLGIAMRPFAKHDPFPEVEPVLDPVVAHRKSDTPEQRRCADALEAATMKAMQAWLRGGR